MEYTADLSAVRWLSPAYYSGPTAEPLTVKDLLSPSYKQYLVLLPPIGIIPGFPFEQVQPESVSIDQINQNVAIWQQYGMDTSGRAPLYQPTTFRELADRFQVPFDVQVHRRLPWAKRGFDLLQEPTAVYLRHLLNELAANASLNLYVEDYWRWGPQMHQILPIDDEVLYRVAADEFVAFLQRTGFDATTYLFPDDRSWCLVNAEDGLAPILGLSTAAQASTLALGETLLLMPDSVLM